MDDAAMIGDKHVVGAALLAAVLVSWGCRFERSFDAHPMVTFADLGSDRQDHESNDYRLSTIDYEAWRFPARLAVVRVTVADTECLPGEPRLVFTPLQGVECPPWIESLQDVPQVSEVFFLQPTDFARRDISVSKIVSEADRYGARLCLVYAESDLVGGGARVIGLLIDTRSGEILATMASNHEPKEHGFEIDRPADRHKDDDRHVDSRYQAALEFRSLVHDCVLELQEKQAAGAGIKRRSQPVS
jgi:hypothetical protein